MELKGRKVAIMIEGNYEDIEFWYPYYRLKEAGAEVVVVGPVKGTPYVGRFGYPIAADVTPAEIDVKDFDALIVPGGYAPDRMRRSKEMVALVRDMDAAGNIVATICHAGWMLVSARVGRGRKATGFHSIQDDMTAAGMEYVDERVVVDGNLITTQEPKDLPEFSRALIEHLARKPLHA